jgi:sulfate transport system permease protein
LFLPSHCSDADNFCKSVSPELRVRARQLRRKTGSKILSAISGAQGMLCRNLRWQTSPEIQSSCMGNFCFHFAKFRSPRDDRLCGAKWIALASFIAAVVNAFFGLLIAWVLVRYSFPGKKLIDALVDLPFALPTAVAGISLTALLASNGWIGSLLEPHGIQLAFNRNGVVIALIFIGLPFVVRTVQPVLEDAEKELEEAATCLGATRWQTFRYVIFPTVAPALLTGFAMAFARAIGEYGSVIFIAGNMPMVSEITPLIIIGKLEQYDYAGATAVAVVLLVISFALLLVINALQAWQRRRSGAQS